MGKAVSEWIKETEPRAGTIEASSICGCREQLGRPAKLGEAWKRSVTASILKSSMM